MVVPVAHDTLLVDHDGCGVRERAARRHIAERHLRGIIEKC
jgi:hypothetical protein